MKVSKETSAKHREALLRAAGRLFRQKGFDKVGVAEIAAAAGLTHGAFYTHFESKEAICAAAIARTAGRVTDMARAAPGWPAYVDGYLSPAHVEDPARGCPYAALGGDVPREGAAVREAFSAGLDQSLGAIEALMPGRSRRAGRADAIAALASMVGAIVLARAADNEALRDEILAAVRSRLRRTASPA